MEPASRTAATSLSNGDDRGCHVSVRCRRVLQWDDRSLMPDGLRALFSQVNSCLRHMFPACAGSVLLTGQHFMIARRRCRTPVQLKIATVTRKQAHHSDGSRKCVAHLRRLENLSGWTGRNITD
jgi:hypothetical protein